MQYELSRSHYVSTYEDFALLVGSRSSISLKKFPPENRTVIVTINYDYLDQNLDRDTDQFNIHSAVPYKVGCNTTHLGSIDIYKPRFDEFMQTPSSDFTKAQPRLGANPKR